MSKPHTDRRLDRMTRLHPALPWILACAVTFLSLLAILRLDAVEQSRMEEQARRETLVRLSTIRAKLEAELNAPLLRARGIVAHIVMNGDITTEEFTRLAALLLEGHRTLRNVVVSRDMVISMTYPLAGNESVVGVDYRSVPEQHAMVLKTIETRGQLIQGPVPLIQGGTGLIARIPVFLDKPDGTPGPFFGMVNTVLDISKIFAEAGLVTDDLPFRVAIRGRNGTGADGPLIFGDPSVFDERPVETDVQLPQGSWQLAAVPHGGWVSVDDRVARMRLMAIGIFLMMAATAFGTARHVTHQAAAARALRAKTIELERSNSDLESFAYVASHDLQTPLRNIVSYAQLLERRYRGRLDQDADEFIFYLVDGATRMSLLVRDLLNYARVSAATGELAPIPVRRSVDIALENLATDIAEARAEIEIGDLPIVNAEETQLTSLFQNLLGNAIRYRSPDRPLKITISARRSQDQAGWTISVADNGVGIDPDYFDKIFVIFQRLHAGGGGTGIGLAVCSRIAHRFGGSIAVESAVGQGATFRVSFPDSGLFSAS